MGRINTYNYRKNVDRRLLNSLKDQSVDKSVSFSMNSQAKAQKTEIRCHQVLGGLMMLETFKRL